MANTNSAACIKPSELRMPEDTLPSLQGHLSDEPTAPSTSNRSASELETHMTDFDCQPLSSVEDSTCEQIPMVNSTSDGAPAEGSAFDEVSSEGSSFEMVSLEGSSFEEVSSEGSSFELLSLEDFCFEEGPLEVEEVTEEVSTSKEIEASLKRSTSNDPSEQATLEDEKVPTDRLIPDCSSQQEPFSEGKEDPGKKLSSEQESASNEEVFSEITSDKDSSSEEEDTAEISTSEDLSEQESFSEEKEVSTGRSTPDYQSEQEPTSEAKVPIETSISDKECASEEEDAAKISTSGDLSEQEDTSEDEEVSAKSSTSDVPSEQESCSEEEEVCTGRSTPDYQSEQESTSEAKVPIETSISDEECASKEDDAGKISTVVDSSFEVEDPAERSTSKVEAIPAKTTSDEKSTLTLRELLSNCSLTSPKSFCDCEGKHGKFCRPCETRKILRNWAKLYFVQYPL